MFSVESTSSLLRELAHLELGDFKASRVNIVNDLANVLVRVGLDHSESTSTQGFEILTSANVSIVSYFHGARKEGYFSANVEVTELNGGNFNFLEEDTCVFHVVHLDFTSDWEVVESVLANDCRLFIVPIKVEHVPLGS